jgi:subtilisin family serine protease
VLTERIQNSKIKGIKVIVGIIDSGVDIEHEDLKSVIWTNSKEIAGNGR